LLIEKPVATPATKVIEAKNSDFLYYRARAISAGDQGPLTKDGSRGWNFNGNKDYFPRKELESSYESFIGRNIFLDHNSESSLYSIGKIIDALPIDDPETGEFYIELVGKIDRTLHPEICRKIETGELNSTSMGCSVDESICSICGHVLHSDADEKCDHMGMNLGKQFPAEVDAPEYNIKKGDMVPCFSINKGIVFNEDSIVGVPADPTAVIKTVLSNMKNQISKKASLTKKEQLDLAAQMDKLFDKLDESTKIQLKADFCGICPPVEKESSMADKSVVPNEETKKILNKISAYEMEQLESYVIGKTKKVAEEKQVVADSVAKEESFLSKIVAKVKDALAGDKPAISAKFQEDKNNVLDSTWSVYEGDKCALEASLKEIWGAQFELLSFDDQKWATSTDYAKEIVSRYTKDGIEKLADAWDVSDKLTKTAKGPELGPDGSYAKPSTGSSNKEHSYPTNPKFEKPKPGTSSKGPAAPAHKDVKDSKVEMPGQEKGQKGQPAPKAKEVKTDYSEPKAEAEGKEVKTTPKNPEEKKMEKSEKEVKTDYVAAGTEAMEAEDKGEKSDKKSSISWASLTPKAQTFIKTAAKKYIESGMKNAEAVAKAHSEFTAQETTMQKKAEGTTVPEGKTSFEGKPIESVDGSTLPDGTKEMGDKAVESVKGDGQPKGSAPSAAPETSAQDDKPGKTPDMTKAPEEAVQDKPTEVGKDKNPDESVKDPKEPAPSDLTSKPEESVKKAAATDMPMPEEKDPMGKDPIVEDPLAEEKPMDLPMGGPKIDEPAAEMSAFDTAENVEIGEGYTANKDKETKEIIVMKDGQEVKRLPDGFGKDLSVVLPLMKAVLGLPPEAAQPEAPGAMPPVEKPMEEPKVEEHPAAEEAHEDELGMKESALKVKEAALAEKEAAITAKEAEIKAAEQSKKFASVLQARTERCKKVIASMVEKDALQMDKEVYESEMKIGTYLLDAQKKAFEHAIKAKQKELLAMDDNALLATEKVIADLKTPSNVNTKRASRIYVSPSFGEELSEDAQLKKIFDTFGTKNRPQ